MGPLTKKRRLDSQQPNELTFDPTARQEYLTGFHKRKVARKENARETAIKREKEERVVQRKQVIFNTLGRSSEGRLTGSAVKQPEEVGQEDEYVDEDKYTTVTVEAMGGSEDDEPAQRKDGEASARPDSKATAAKKRLWSKTNPADGKPKPKKRKFRYESKSERQDTRRKQKNKNQAAAKARREKSS
ncbi:hypothetical protein B0A55_04520 [Friedmanniomyces simplex]|uniref:Ribosomal RNA-processing protein 17 n=1 Tax=Friedmanniomyces simplex TaxID=329884 RepID=A0A4U0XIA0_9PEZI|nr:hypothetical protein B0A55_04520 [Friedmanniomyces simplex]